MRNCFYILTLLVSSLVFGQSFPIGTPNHGSLENAECLPEEGEGYMQLFRDVEHIWGTFPMIDMIEKSAADIAQKYPGRDRLQVEDISAKNGGDIDPHGSHENGQDVDLEFFKANGIEHKPTHNEYATPMVIDGQLSSNFDAERNWELMKALHRHGNVQKIFVDKVLKAELCRFAKSRNDYANNVQVLRSLRNEENHQDHMHVRLRCPKNAPKCVNLPDPPAGSGCP
jgi:penicillin-insensitive murein endopeptidase